jgi:nucleoside-diphosphate-sugar epimerase
MKIAVTGAAGYLGSVLLPRLLAEPDVEEVRAFDRRPVAGPAADSARVRSLRVDVRAGELVRYLEGCDAVVHLAFVVVDHAAGLSRAEIDSINVEGTRNLVQAAQAAGVSQLVYTSSAAAYGSWTDNPPRIIESWPLRGTPGFYYAETKARVEQLLDELAPDSQSLRVVRLRPHVIVGPRLGARTRLLFAARVLPVMQEGDPEQQLVWEDDVAEAVVLALRARAQGAFNLGAEPCPVSASARASGARVLRLPHALLRAPMALAWKLGRGFDPGWVDMLRYRLIVDSSRARTELGWAPRHDTLGCVRALKAGVP